MTRRNAFVAQLALAIASVVLCLGGAELYFRIFRAPTLYTAFGPSSAGVADVETWGLPDDGFYENTALGKRLRANVSGVIHHHHLTGRDVALRTNAYGFRGPDIVFDARPRVLFLGDSITLGDYLDEDDTFVHQVGVRFAASGTPIQTLNAGVGAIGIEEELDILRERGPQVEPDRVVLDLYLNDVEPSPALRLLPIPGFLRWSAVAQHVYQARSVRAYARTAAGEGFAIPASERQHWLEQTIQRYPPGPGDWRVQRAAYNGLIVDWFRDWGAAYSDGAQRRIAATAEEIIALSRRLGAAPFVVLHPTKFQVEAAFETDEPQRALVALLADSGAPVLDLLPALRERYRSTGRSLFLDQCHHTVEGAALVADQIYAFLRTSLPASAR